MRQLIFILCLFLILPGFAQRTIYSDIFNNNGKICLTLSSDDDFVIKIYFDNSEENDNDIVCCAKGKVIYKNDKITCVNSQTGKKIVFIRVSHNEVIKAINWDDYKSVSYSCPNTGEKIFLSNLIDNNPDFFIRVKQQQMYENNDSTFVTLYSWEKGEKRIIFEGFQNMSLKKNKPTLFDSFFSSRRL